MKKRFSLATWIAISLLLGIVAGIALMGHSDIAQFYIRPFGTLFLNLIQMIVVPIVLFSIISGVISLSDIKKVGSIGIKTIIFYLFTTAFAIAIGLFCSNFIKMVDISTLSINNTFSPTIPKAPSLMDTLINIFPSNAVKPLVNATMIQVIVIAIFFGFGIILAGEKGKPAAKLVDSLTEVVMQIMGFIIKLSPVGVFALICPVVAENGVGVLRSLAKFVGTTYVIYILHAVLIYSSIVKCISGISPLKFFKEATPVMLMAFSSASSVGALPLNIECCERLGTKKEVASFVLPLGATINMDGTAIYQGVAAAFIAQAFGINLTLSQMLTIIVTATLASIGTAGVPGAGMIMLAMVLESVGLPLEGIALIAGVDRILDMGRTAVNVTGDTACAVSISSIEKRKERRRKIKQ